MERLRNWIAREAEVLGPEFVRVDGILNHRIEPRFIELIGEGLASAFRGTNVSCVLTAEAAGNIVAYELARRLGVRALYAKKGDAATMIRPISRTVTSPTKGTTTQLSICSEYLGDGDRAVIVDDFLFRGNTSAALADLVAISGASLVAFGFVIEKAFAGGRGALERFGVPIISLAVIESMDPENGTITFAEAV